jgi:hypothetical protein
MELKTLKDMKDFVISQQMFEIARGDTITGKFVNRNELIEEAVKWIKEIKEFRKNSDDLLYEALTGNIIAYSDEGKEAVTNFIKTFFNITEEDLK